MGRERKSDNGLISAKQLTAIHLLATGFSQRNVCRIVGISPVTLNKWWDEPSFCAEFYRATGFDGRQKFKVGSSRRRECLGRTVTAEANTSAGGAGADS
jgi:hypothetical protein